MNVKQLISLFYQRQKNHTENQESGVGQNPTPTVQPSKNTGIHQSTLESSFFGCDIPLNNGKGALVKRYLLLVFFISLTVLAHQSGRKIQ
jgi:hypothetical protein